MSIGDELEISDINRWTFGEDNIFRVGFLKITPKGFLSKNGL